MKNNKNTTRRRRLRATAVQVGGDKHFKTVAVCVPAAAGWLSNTGCAFSRSARELATPRWRRSYFLKDEITTVSLE